MGQNLDRMSESFIMTEDLIKEIKEKIEEKSYIPNDWDGVSERKVVNLNDVIDVLNEYRPKEKYWW